MGSSKSLGSKTPWVEVGMFQGAIYIPFLFEASPSGTPLQQEPRGFSILQQRVALPICRDKMMDTP